QTPDAFFVQSSMLSTLRGPRLPFGKDFEIAYQDTLRAVEVGPCVRIGVGRRLLQDLGVCVVGRADDDRRTDRLAVDLEVDVIVLLSLEADGVGGERPDLF